jgi:predicted dehydrogenase
VVAAAAIDLSLVPPPAAQLNKVAQGFGDLLMVRVGLIGYGYWGPNLLRNFAMAPQFQVVGVAERKPEARQRVARGYPAVHVLEDAGELLARSDIDAVVIATPLETHFALAREALSRGKHVLVEKPISSCAAEAEELIVLARRMDRVLMVDHTFLFTGAVRTIRDVSESGALGKICYFDSMRVNLGLFQPDMNCLWDLAPHDLSVIDYILQDEIVAVEASGYCHVNQNMPDMVYLTLHYAGNAIAHFNLSWMSPVKVRRFAIGGTRQMLIWDDLDQDQKIRIYNTGIEFHPDSERATIIPEYRIGDIYSPRVPQREALAGVVDHFGNVISKREDSIMDGERALKVVRILEQAQKQLEASLADVAARRRAAS